MYPKPFSLLWRSFRRRSAPRSLTSSCGGAGLWGGRGRAAARFRFQHGRHSGQRGMGLRGSPRRSFAAIMTKSPRMKP